MEYCITVFVETFQPGAAFSRPQPRQTAWGEAYRAEEVGKYFWPGALYVEPEPLRATLMRYLPSDFQCVDWRALTIGGTGLSAFEQQVNASNHEVESIELENHPLLSLIQELLGNQPHWAVFFMKDCDQINAVYSQNLAELCQTIAEAYRWHGEANQGFCSISSL